MLVSHIRVIGPADFLVSCLGNRAILGIVSEDKEFGIWRMKINLKSAWHSLIFHFQVVVSYVCMEMKRSMLWKHTTMLSNLSGNDIRSLDEIKTKHSNAHEKGLVSVIRIDVSPGI